MSSVQRVNWGGAYTLVPLERERPSPGSADAGKSGGAEQALIGNAEAMAQVRRWFEGVARDGRRAAARPLLIVADGPGLGKTTCVRRIAGECGVRLVEAAKEGLRGAHVVDAAVRQAQEEGAVAWFDDVHSEEGEQPAMLRLRDAAAEAAVAMVLCSNAPCPAFIESAVAAAGGTAVALGPVGEMDIAMLLGKRSRALGGGGMPFFDCLRLAKRSRGDVRAALVDMQFWAPRAVSAREQSGSGGKGGRKRRREAPAVLPEGVLTARDGRDVEGPEVSAASAGRTLLQAWRRWPAAVGGRSCADMAAIADDVATADVLLTASREGDDACEMAAMLCARAARGCEGTAEWRARKRRGALRDASAEFRGTRKPRLDALRPEDEE
ncbi:hypothetical protein JKP88DRAFT_273034 [Tribonema minus]|uniref:ATPase AAA-type core domain-containing protein n=1 Tax=Tribonema minus TaxID=303371 RepID=A0A835Z6D7_9STRA|nr:hypothetical protein JKP88DRAFT_273034 [Tribonema minus]